MNMIDVLVLLICAQCPQPKVTKEYPVGGAVSVCEAVEVFVEICVRALQPVLATRVTLTAYDIASITVRDQNQRV